MTAIGALLGLKTAITEYQSDHVVSSLSMSLFVCVLTTNALMFVVVEESYWTLGLRLYGFAVSLEVLATIGWIFVLGKWTFAAPGQSW
jgi:hypothetical protein